MKFSIYQESKLGARKMNQDRMGYCFTSDSLLLLLADGMGGHVQGEVAADIAMRTIASLFQNEAQPGIKNPERFLEQSFLAAHDAICAYAKLNNMNESPRTTMVACVIQENHCYFAHAGDSRFYWLRNGEVKVRTSDHSRLENLIRQGKVAPMMRSTHPDRNKLYNCLGSPILPMVDVGKRILLDAGDILLLCSDGFWSYLSEDDLARKLTRSTIVRAIPELIDLAIAEAAEQADNTTALAVMWESAADTVEEMTITTQTMPKGVFSTTVQAELPQGMTALALDDDEIERSIAEINQAIQKSIRLIS